MESFAFPAQTNKMKDDVWTASLHSRINRCVNLTSKSTGRSGVFTFIGSISPTPT